MRKYSFVFAVTLVSFIFSPQLYAMDSVPPYSQNLLQTVQQQASSVPGDFPIAIHYAEYATTKRTMADSIEGGDAKVPYIQSRTAYQIVYPSGTIMVDSGMTKQMNVFFGKAEDLTYSSQTNEQIQTALLKSKKVIITHEHGDHVGGVIQTKYFNQLAPKTLLTFQQANSLENNPQMPAMKLSKEQVNQFDLVDFREYLPVAPGVVLIKAPGHTAGEIMVYVKLQNNEQYIIAGDVSWTYQGIQSQTTKPLSQIKRIQENPEQIKQELAWLHNAAQQNIHIIINHDEEHHQDFVKKGLLIQGLQ